MDNTKPPDVPPPPPPKEQQPAAPEGAGTLATPQNEGGGAEQEGEGKGPLPGRARFVAGMARTLRPRSPDPNKVDEEEREQYEKRYKTFFEFATTQRNQYVTAQAEQAKTYDQTILTFSAGAIALSITFIEKIAPNPSAPCFLYCAWGAFALAVLSVIVSFVISQIAFDREIQQVDRNINAANAGEETLPTQEPNRYTTWTWILNSCSGTFFVLGIAFFVLFGFFNWPSQKPVTALSTERRLKVEFSGEVVPEKLTVTNVAPTDTGKTPPPVSRPQQRPAQQPSQTQTAQPVQTTSPATPTTQ